MLEKAQCAQVEVWERDTCASVDVIALPL